MLATHPPDVLQMDGGRAASLALGVEPGLDLRLYGGITPVGMLLDYLQDQIVLLEL
jgi:hypothetical protein